MVQFSADLDCLFTEYTFLERPKMAQENGFSAIEFTLQNDLPLGQLGDVAAYKGLKTSLITMPEKEAAFAFQKQMKSAFIESMDRLIEVADFLECKKIYIPGKVLDDETFDDSREAFISALKAIAPKAKHAGIKVLLGFKNPTENPQFYPASTLEVLEILDELGDDKAFGFLYDVYEAQTIEGGISNTLEALSDIIAHVRIAGVPLHEEPDLGEINYDYIFFLLETHGYGGCVGCSYTPRLKTEQGLGWLKK